MTTYGSGHPYHFDSVRMMQDDPPVDSWTVAARYDWDARVAATPVEMGTGPRNIRRTNDLAEIKYIRSICTTLWF